MDAETWYTAAECVDCGLADEMTDTDVEIAAFARFDLSKFKNLPEQLKSMTHATASGAAAIIAPEEKKSSEPEIPIAESRTEAPAPHPKIIKAAAQLAFRGIKTGQPAKP